MLCIIARYNGIKLCSPEQRAEMVPETCIIGGKVAGIVFVNESHYPCHQRRASSGEKLQRHWKPTDGVENP